VGRLANGATHSRRAFTLAELEKVLCNADETWRGMVLFGVYCGLRLTDCARLTWNNVDLQSQELTFRVRKTGRVQIVPLAAPLLAYMHELPASDDPNTPLWPDLAMHSANSLSKQFRRLLVQAGLVAPEYEKGAGRRRTVSELSFHNLRHTSTSLLKRAGVSEAVAMAIVGHRTAAVSQRYSHIDTSTMRAALDKLPDVRGPNS